MNKRGLSVVLLLVIIAFSIGYVLPNTLPYSVKRKDVLSTDNNCPYVYINQLRCEPDTVALQKKEYTTLRNDLIDYIEKEKEAKHVTFASVYFRDLQNGPTMSIDSSENFAPASLLKVPLMIMYFKKAEADPNLLKQKVKAEGNIESLQQNIIPERRVTAGQEYSIEELINLLVTQSDNTAWKMLLNYLRANFKEQDFIDTLSDLGVIDPRKDTDMQYITVQNYASIFRILYNSSYLNREMSDKALRLLTDSAFKDGLESGTPADVEVAHKFGEIRNEGNGEQQLHDCGIVYYPSNPYLICIMTKGDNIKELEKVISHISNDVHQEISGRSVQ